MKKRYLALLLAIMLCVGMLPHPALAEGEELTGNDGTEGVDNVLVPGADLILEEDEETTAPVDGAAVFAPYSLSEDQASVSVPLSNTSENVQRLVLTAKAAGNDAGVVNGYNTGEVSGNGTGVVLDKKTGTGENTGTDENTGTGEAGVVLVGVNEGTVPTNDTGVVLDKEIGTDENTGTGEAGVVLVGVNEGTVPINDTGVVLDKEIGTGAGGSATPISIANAVVQGISGPTNEEELKQGGFSVVLNGTVLRPNTDYTWEASDVPEEKKVYLGIFGQGNYEGVAEASFSLKNDTASSTLIDLGSVTAKLVESSFSYTGQQWTPAVGVEAADGTTLIKGTHYGLTYGNNTNAGPGTVTLTPVAGVSNGTQTLGFTIDSASIDACSLGSVPSPTDENTVTAEQIVLSFGGKNLVPDDDFTIEAADDPDHGVCTVYIYGNGNFDGMMAVNVTLAVVAFEPIDITDASVAVESAAYTGSPLTPAVTVSCLGETLRQGVDYTVTCADCVGVGNYTVTVTGIGNYTGTADGTFAITPADLSGADVSLSWTSRDFSTSFTYEETPIVTGVTLSVGDETRTLEVTDYDVNPYPTDWFKKAGNYTVTVTGKGNYSGTASATFTLNPINIEGGGISMSGDSATYDGTDKKPTVSGVMLSSGEGLLTDDYDLSYEPSGDWINAGNYTITAKGKNNAYGTVNKTFTVEPVTEGITITGGPEKTSEATLDKSSFVVKWGETTLVLDRDYEVIATDNHPSQGYCNVKIRGKGNFAFDSDRALPMEEPELIDISGATVTLSPASAPYTGNAVGNPTETVKVTVDGVETTLVKNTDYTVTYTAGNWTSAGEYTVTVTGKGNCTGTASAIFTIEPASVAGGEIGGVTVPANATAIQNDGVTVSVGGRTLKAGVDYDLSVTESNGVVTVSVIGKGNYKDTLSANYTSVTTQIIDLSSANVTVALGGSQPAGNSTGGYAYEFTGEQIRPTVEVTHKNGTLEQDTDYNVTYGENTNVGTGSVTIRPGNNSRVNGSRSIQFTIVPRSIVNANVTGVTEPATREQVEQNVAVVVNGRTLGPNDFTTDVRQQGRLVNVTITGQGNYKDSLSLQFNRSIEAGDTDLSVVIGDAPTGSGAVYAYTGDQIRPSLNVSVDGQSLTQGTDYSVSYRNNTDAGQGTVIVGPGRNGIINFTRAYNFTITPRYLDNMSFEGVNGATNATTIQNNTAAIRVMVDGRELKVGEDFHLDAQDLPEAGVCIVVVTGQGNYEGEWSVNFTLTSSGGTGGGNATAETDEPEPPNLLQVTLEKLSEIAMRIIALLESRNDGQGVEWDILFYQSGVDPANASSSPYSEDNPTGYVFINTLIPGMQDGSGRVIFTNQSTSNITLKSGQYLYDQVINLTDSQFHGSLKTNTTYGVTFTEGVRVVSGNFSGSVITSQPSAVVNVRIPDPSEGAVTFLSNSAANSTGTNGTGDNGGAANKGGQAVTYPADLNCRLTGHVRTGELVLKGRFTRAAEDGNVTVTCYEATFACSRCGTDLGGTCFAVIGAADDVEPGRDANVTDTRNGLSLDGVFAKDGDLFFDGKVLRSLADANGGAYDYRKVQTADGFAIEFSKAFLNKQADGEHQVLIINGDEFWPLMVSFQGHRLDGLRLAIQDEAPAMTEAEYEAWRQTAAAKGDGVQELTVGKGK